MTSTIRSTRLAVPQRHGAVRAASARQDHVDTAPDLPRIRCPRAGWCRCVTVTGRSVLCRRVRHGTPSAVVSSWIPPESVRTSRAFAISPRNVM